MFLEEFSFQKVLASLLMQTKAVEHSQSFSVFLIIQSLNRVAKSGQKRIRQFPKHKLDLVALHVVPKKRKKALQHTVWIVLFGSQIGHIGDAVQQDVLNDVRIKYFVGEPLYQ